MSDHNSASASKTAEPSADKTRGILTIAHGKPRYLRMARNLALSLKQHAPDMPRAVVTDAPEGYFEGYYDVIIPHDPSYGRNVEQKLHLDLYSPFQQTLFIDADSLLCGSLHPIFDQYRGKTFITPGFEYISPGSRDTHWKVNFDKVFQAYPISKLPKFNGGIYYFEAGENSRKFFETARGLLVKTQDLEIEDFRGNGPPDEVLFSIAMAIHELDTQFDEGKFMRTLFGLSGKLRLDTIHGGCRFKKNGEWVTPAIMHFASFGACHPAYARECLRLRAHHARHVVRKVLLWGAIPFRWIFDSLRWRGISIARSMKR